LSALVTIGFGTGFKTIDLINNSTLSIDYSLTEDPIFTDQYMSFDISGSIITDHLTKTGSPCPFSKKELPSNYTGSNAIAVALDTTLVDCTLWLATNPWVIEGLAETFVGLALDERISVHARLKGTPTWTFTDPKSLKSSIDLDVYVPFTRADFKPPVTFLSFETKIHIDSDATIVPANSTGDITIYNLTLSGLTQEMNEKLMPPFYAAQLKAENWAGIEFEANTLLHGILPHSFSFPLAGVSKVQNLEYQTTSNYVLISLEY